ncbi:MAG: metallophosphoesterase, partial [Thermoleophilia bacterium]|nr:metallophosphoesterase [Thermoleophilia bacterium]
GSYAVLGNHDYDDDSGAAAAAAARKAGITLLRNAGVWLESQGARLRLCGVEDYQLGSPQLTPALGDANTSDFVLLVSHNPDFAGELSPGALDLMLSGHTHGGQVTLFGLWAPFVPSKYGQKFRSGMVSTEAATVVISNGIGTIFPPIRLGARPQIVRITLTTGQNL